MVGADPLALGRQDGPGFARQVAIEELAERPLADEADAGRVLLGRVVQPDLVGDAPHLGLAQFTQRKQGARQLHLVEAMQEIALVLGVVQGLEQLVARPGRRLDGAHPGIVPGGDMLGAQRHGVVQEGLELDLGVAQHVGIGRAAGRVLAQELGEHPVLVFGGKIDVFELDADQVGDAGRVQQVLARRAVFGIVVVFPVLHEQADDLIALLLEQPGGHR
ncbi:Uncharacterised protein [Bordetella pertussis]|nr:Uncharacterised protein [Bordetella pertussis]